MRSRLKFKTAENEVAVTLKEGRRFGPANATVVADRAPMNSAANTPNSIGQ